jgi:hypothetical protein
MESEIIASTVHAPDAAEPMLTLSQLQSLLRAAAELERAQRPIVLHGPQPVTAPHPGADIRIPATAFTRTPAPKPRNIWPLVFMTAGAVGFSSGTAAIATGNQAAVAVACVAIAAWSTATYRLVFCREA